MFLSDCVYCGKNVWKAHESHPCDECKALIELKNRMVREGTFPVFDGTQFLDGPISETPGATAGTDCSLCGTRLHSMAFGRPSIGGRSLFFCGRCKSILEQS